MSTNIQKKPDPDAFQWSFLHPRYWITWLGLGLSILPSLLPYTLIIKLGRTLGRLVYRVAGRRVHIARVNLEKCFPELSSDQREVLLKKNFESVGMGVLEVTMAWWWPVRRFEKLVTFKGLEHLKGDKGTILLVMHFTTIELAGRLITLHQSIDATYREHKNPVFEYMQRRRRQHLDPNGALLGRLDVRGMLRSLRKGRTCWYSPDQDYGTKQSLFASFFGIPAATVTGTSRFARLGRAQVVPMFVNRLEGCKGYELCLYEPWDNFPSDDEQADTERVNAFVEARVREYPEQYMWLHRRFKNRPDDDDFYR
ncbi:lipid A biosynthesis lauroyl acyltransferase [Endozoicomonas sp. (ex Bugula neritina AB1)]|nr:lipid A biosynthesis lauroyl acyltransferase [Endozoicomonas sp. (ex Bugula neritina AB1)]